MSKPLVHQITERARGFIADPRKLDPVRHRPYRQQPSLRADGRQGARFCAYGAILRAAYDIAGSDDQAQRLADQTAMFVMSRDSPYAAFEELIAINDGQRASGAQERARPVRQGDGQRLRGYKSPRAARGCAKPGGGAGLGRRRPLCWSHDVGPMARGWRNRRVIVAAGQHASESFKRERKAQSTPCPRPTLPFAEPKRTMSWRPRAPGSARTAASRWPPWSAPGARRRWRRRPDGDGAPTAASRAPSRAAAWRARSSPRPRTSWGRQAQDARPSASPTRRPGRWDCPCGGQIKVFLERWTAERAARSRSARHRGPLRPSRPPGQGPASATATASSSSAATSRPTTWYAGTSRAARASWRDAGRRGVPARAGAAGARARHRRDAYRPDPGAARQARRLRGDGDRSAHGVCRRGALPRHPPRHRVAAGHHPEDRARPLYGRGGARPRRPHRRRGAEARACGRSASTSARWAPGGTTPSARSA